MVFISFIFYLTQNVENVDFLRCFYYLHFLLMFHKFTTDFAMANVTCEYDGGGNGDDSDINNSLNAGAAGNNGEPGRRIRRSETLLRQAAECVSRGQTFQTVSDMFSIPISTIRYI